MENGTYRGKFIGWDLDTTKNGDEVLLVHLELVESGEQVSVQLHQSEKAKPYSDAKLQALGWKGKGHPLEGLDQEVDVIVKTETYNGNTRQKADISAGGALKIKPFNTMSTAQKNDFLKRLTGVSANSNGAAPKAHKPSASQSNEEDDTGLPF